MRLLWIKTELLHPVDKGGRIRSYQMLRSLAQRHHVTYLCLDDGQAAADALERAHEYAHEVVTVPFAPPPKGTAGYLRALLLNLFSPLPYAIGRYQSAELRAQIARLAGSSDLVVCDFLMSSVNVPEALPAPTVLFQHNVEAQLWERHATVPQNMLRRAYMQLQWHRMQRYEEAQCRRFDHVVGVSALDAALMRRQYGVSTVSHVETGVDFEFFSAQAPRDGAGQGLVFVGSMDWMPNDDGIRWFAGEVFPEVRRRTAGVRLVVVGRAPSPGLRELAARDPAIEITGTVADVRPYLRRAALSVVPLRVGGGTRLKIYEAMATGVPVVSTAIGAEGLPLRSGEHLLIADSAADQVSAICGLLDDPARASALAANALAFVRQYCSWDAVAERFIAHCPDRSVPREHAYHEEPA